MKSSRQPEERLEQIPAPCVVEGFHRQELKQQLMELHGKGRKMQARKAIGLSRKTKVAAAVIAAILLVTAGWAGEKVYQRVYKGEPFLREEPEVVWEGDITTPDGNQKHFVVGLFKMRSGGDPNLTEEQARQKVDEQSKEMASLIDQGRYEFVKTYTLPSGQKKYIYRFTRANGESFGAGSPFPLEEIKSGEEYFQRLEEYHNEQKKHLVERQEKIKQAIAKGKFRLLDVDVIKTHLCKDLSSGQKIEVIQIVTLDGNHLAAVHFDSLEKAGSGYTTDWEDHLKAVAEGERELLDIRAIHKYSYEITFEDGSTTLWTYGDDAPLQKREE